MKLNYILELLIIGTGSLATTLFCQKMFGWDGLAVAIVIGACWGLFGSSLISLIVPPPKPPQEPSKPEDK